MALNRIFGFEPKFSHNLIDALGSTEAVFSLSLEDKRRIFGPCNRYLDRINDSAVRTAAEEYARLTDKGMTVLSIFDKDYPSLLRDCPDAPVALYVRSSTPPEQLFNTGPAIAVVGTRDLSLYGREWCQRVVGAASQAPSRPVIVSGMAIGIDVTAHLAALETGLPTIGVLPVGIDDIYPRRHRLIADRMAETPGCALITDYPPGTSPTAVNFLRRNRIIAGMCGATVLVESRIKGGGMMTARLASGYGREVVALPGRIDDIRSEGCNLLIREKTAEPLNSLASFPEQVGLGTYSLRRKADLMEAVSRHFSGVLPDEDLRLLSSMVQEIKNMRGICFDGLCQSLNMDYADVSRFAGLLENEGIISVDLMQRCTINTFFK